MENILLRNLVVLKIAQSSEIAVRLASLNRMNQMHTITITYKVCNSLTTCRFLNIVIIIILPNVGGMHSNMHKSRVTM